MRSRPMSAKEAVHKIHYTSHYLRAYKKLPKKIRATQDKREPIFKNNPFSKRLETHKLKGKYKKFFSYSVTQSFRVLFRFIKKDEVIFYDIDTHDIYK